MKDQLGASRINHYFSHTNHPTWKYELRRKTDNLNLGCAPARYDLQRNQQFRHDGFGIGNDDLHLLAFPKSSLARIIHDFVG